MIANSIAKARKILIKIGSNTLASEDGRINIQFMAEMAEQIASLRKQGKQFILVSSGARIAGLSRLGKWGRKKDLHYKQALCAIGQVELMNAWKEAFASQGIVIAQLLLTRDDFTDEYRTLNIRNTLYTLLDEGVLPIINENDSVCVQEIKIGDNDNLAALAGILWSADLLVLFSDTDGLYTKNPKQHRDAKPIDLVTDVGSVRDVVSIEGVNGFGTGGMDTKLHAAESLLSNGISMVLAHGGKPRALEALAKGSQSGTLFSAN